MLIVPLYSLFHKLNKTPRKTLPRMSAAAPPPRPWSAWLRALRSLILILMLILIAPNSSRLPLLQAAEAGSNAAAAAASAALSGGAKGASSAVGGRAHRMSLLSRGNPLVRRAKLRGYAWRAYFVGLRVHARLEGTSFEPHVKDYHFGCLPAVHAV